MSCTLKTLVVLILAALMPLRALAAVTVGFCATGHQERAAAALGDHEHSAHAHTHQGDDKAPAEPFTPTCSICVEHCSNAVFATADAQAIVGVAMEENFLPHAARAAPAFFPDQLDRPPLAQLR